MSNKKNKLAVDVLLDYNSSSSAKSKAIQELWVESKEDLTYQCKDGYRFIDVLILHTLDYNGIGHSEQLISKFLKKYGQDIVSIIEKDTTDDNPIALITRHRSSSILLKQLLDQTNFSEENIKAKPGLKMLISTFKSITPSHFHHPSDFVLILDEKLSKYKHLNKFTNELKTAYAISNLFKHKKVTKDVLDSFGIIAQKSLNYSEDLDNDLNPNPSYVNVVKDGFDYLNKMDSSDIEIFKSKLEKELICDLSTLDERSLHILQNIKTNFNFNLNNICNKLELVDVKISNGYQDPKTLYEYNADLIIRSLSKKIGDITYNLSLNNDSIAQKIIDINESKEFETFKTYYSNIKNSAKTIAIEEKSIKQIDYLIENLEKNIEVIKQKTSIKSDFMQIKLVDLSMAMLHMHLDDPLVEKIFKKLEKQFKEQDIENFKLISQISGIVQLDGILPNRNDILKNINENFTNLWENNLVLSANGSIIKNSDLDNSQRNQEVLLKQKQNKELLTPLINELNKINLLFKEIFVVKEPILIAEKESKKVKLKN